MRKFGLIVYTDLNANYSKQTDKFKVEKATTYINPPKQIRNNINISSVSYKFATISRMY